jgi:hypothetical protein
VSIKESGTNKKSHTLDNNDFKLKDHTGTKVPLSDILTFIDVDSPNLRVDQGDPVDSNASFSTKTAVKDYSWIGTKTSKEEIILTVYFELASDFKVENTIMIFETDFYVGYGKTRNATDIILFKRKEPII